MGVSATAATTNQNCVSERLRIGMMSHAEDAAKVPMVPAYRPTDGPDRTMLIRLGWRDVGLINKLS
jgi:hypothetical protein